MLLPVVSLIGIALIFAILHSLFYAFTYETGPLWALAGWLSPKLHGWLITRGKGRTWRKSIRYYLPHRITSNVNEQGQRIPAIWGWLFWNVSHGWLDYISECMTNGFDREWNLAKYNSRPAVEVLKENGILSACRREW